MFSKDEDEVADLFQDILMNLWKGFERFRGESSIRTWLYRVSLNTCISADRKKRRNGESVPLDMNIDLFDDSAEEMKQIVDAYAEYLNAGRADFSFMKEYTTGHYKKGAL